MDNIDMKFIAKKAGVSIATVSRVINNTKKVSEPLRVKVLNEIDKYSYRPNTLARSLITKRSNLIGVIMPNVSDMYHAKLLSGIERCAEKSNYNIVVSNIYANFEKEKKSFDVFSERCIDGIILLHENTPEELQELANSTDIPIVLANVNVEGSKIPCVGIDDVAATFDAVSYLLRIGHTKIAGIFGKGYTLDTLRKQGYTKALQSAGVKLNQDLIVHSECSIAGGVAAAKILLQNTDLPTAIFCVSDEIAIGVMDYLAKLGYEVPAQISVFGFDNIDLAGIFRPKLSTVEQPVDEIGVQAARTLINMIQKTEVKQKYILGHNLVLRASCKNITAL